MTVFLFEPWNFLKDEIVIEIVTEIITEIVTEIVTEIGYFQFKHLTCLNIIEQLSY